MDSSHSQLCSARTVESSSCGTDMTGAGVCLECVDRVGVEVEGGNVSVIENRPPSRAGTVSPAGM